MLCVRAVKNPKQLLNDICALDVFLKNVSEKNLLKVLRYGAEDLTYQINSEILKCTIKLIKKKKKKKIDCLSGPLFLYYFFFYDQVFNI